MVMSMEKSKKTKAGVMLSANNAGELLGVSGKTVIRMMESGDFPGYKVGFAWKFKRGDIESYLESQRYQPETGDQSES